MTRAGVFLTAALAAASLGLFAQDRSTSAASSPAAVTPTSSQNSPSAAATQPAATSNSARKAETAPNSTSNATSASPKGAIESAAANDQGAGNSQLPQTSTILPLLGLIGLGSLVAGLFARR
jgi:cobalamin biosynthesis Mg chelatase CobN